ncbi:hypothetical protein BB560_001275 [Smittium megazygosporum]|uniref:Uncharacterized protein n=1 Tax=Smittium megazygosporum TaxID=133381 RepID=A0A2T9ZI17_9FUNG|nr:hypothetical protein BB560_001275 [Smittium megazygosporum]
MSDLRNKIIEIPLQGSENVLEIDCDDLPESSRDICDVLEQEEAEIRFFLIFALEYYKQKKIDEAILLLKRGLSKESTTDMSAKLPLINCLANIYIQKAKTFHLSEPFNSSISGEPDGQTLVSNFDLEQIKSGREAFLQLATALFKEADRIQPNNITTQLGKGVLYLVSNQYDLALPFFNNVLKVSPNNVTALVGAARIQYTKNQYHQALEKYRRALRFYPEGDFDPRIGIGLCLYKLGNVRDATIAFEKALQKNSNQVAPLILLSIIKLNTAKELLISENLEGDSKDSKIDLDSELSKGIEYISSGYHLNPDNPTILVHLSNLFYYRGDLEKSAELATKAYRFTELTEIKAESQFQIARIYHSQKDYSKAYDGYQKTLAIMPDHPLAKLSLGKLQIYRSEMAAAITTFQQLLTRYPRCTEILHILGYIYSTLNNQKIKAVEYYETEITTIAAQGNLLWKGDWSTKLDLFSTADTFLECARLLQNSNITKCLKFYEASKSILSKSSLENTSDINKDACATVEILNNIGVLKLFQDNNNEGIEELLSALGLHKKIFEKESDKAKGPEENLDSQTSQSIEGQSLVERYKDVDSTLYYNLGRAYESVGNIEKAKEIFSSLLEKYPGYIDAQLRLGMLYMNYYKDFDKSEECISQALSLKSTHIPALILKAQLTLSRGSLQPGRKCFENILINVNRHEIYTLLSLGNYYLQAIRSEIAIVKNIKQVLDQENLNSSIRGSKVHESKSKHSSDAIKADYRKHLGALNTNYKRAHEFFKKAYEINNKCPFSISGFAAIMAEKKYLNNALDFFSAAREVQSAQLPENAVSGISDPSGTVDSGFGNMSGADGYGSKMFSLEYCMSLSPESGMPLVLSDGTDQGYNVMLSSNLARVYLELGDNQNAINLYELSIGKLESKMQKMNISRYDDFPINQHYRNLGLGLSKALYIKARLTKSIPLMKRAISNLTQIYEEFIKMEERKGNKGDKSKLISNGYQDPKGDDNLSSSFNEDSVPGQLDDSKDRIVNGTNVSNKGSGSNEIKIKAEPEDNDIVKSEESKADINQTSNPVNDSSLNSNSQSEIKIKKEGDLDIKTEDDKTSLQKDEDSIKKENSTNDGDSTDTKVQTGSIIKSEQVENKKTDSNKKKVDFSSVDKPKAANDVKSKVREEDQLPVISMSKSEEKLVLVDGCDPIILYNLALAKQILAQLLSEIPPEQYAKEDYQSIVDGLRESSLVFIKLGKAKEQLQVFMNEKMEREKGADLAKPDISSTKNSNFKLSIDPKLSTPRASFGRFLLSDLEKKIQKYSEEEQRKWELAEESRKRRLEKEAQKKAEEAAALEARRKEDERLLEITRLRNEQIRQEMALGIREERGRDRSEIQSEDDDYRNNAEYEKDFVNDGESRQGRKRKDKLGRSDSKRKQRRYNKKSRDQYNDDGDGESPYEDAERDLVHQDNFREKPRQENEADDRYENNAEIKKEKRRYTGRVTKERRGGYSNREETDQLSRETLSREDTGDLPVRDTPSNTRRRTLKRHIKRVESSESDIENTEPVTKKRSRRPDSSEPSKRKGRRKEPKISRKELANVAPKEEEEDHEKYVQKKEMEIFGSSSDLSSLSDAVNEFEYNSDLDLSP